MCTHREKRGETVKKKRMVQKWRAMPKNIPGLKKVGENTRAGTRGITEALLKGNIWDTGNPVNHRFRVCQKKGFP